MLTKSSSQIWSSDSDFPLIPTKILEFKGKKKFFCKHLVLKVIVGWDKHFSDFSILREIKEQGEICGSVPS